MCKKSSSSYYNLLGVIYIALTKKKIIEAKRSAYFFELERSIYAFYFKTKNAEADGWFSIVGVES